MTARLTRCAVSGDDARTVSAGFECGVKLDKFEDIKVGDIIEVYRLESVAKTLA